jgi:uncharacterized low-complexity protein
MKREIVLGIAVASLLSANAFAAPQDADGAPASAGRATNGGGGKCASGKCGTEKIYGKKADARGSDGAQVHARDGKCGLSGKGYKVAESNRDRLAEGVCGK